MTKGKDPCSVITCVRLEHCFGLCKPHYDRFHRTGRVDAHRPVLSPSMTAEERFWSFVLKLSDCWLWAGCKRGDGYGEFRGLAHRFAYEAVKGPIPDGLVLDHLCREELCVNPAHLEAVPQRENVLRGFGKTSEYAARTHCGKGHPFSGDNLRPRPDGSRECLACRRIWSQTSRSRRAARRSGSAK